MCVRYGWGREEGVTYAHAESAAEVAEGDPWAGIAGVVHGGWGRVGCNSRRSGGCEL